LSFLGEAEEWLNAVVDRKGVAAAENPESTERDRALSL
jgi:hypothetical protein